MKKFIEKNGYIIWGSFFATMFGIAVFSLVIAMLNAFIG